MGKTVKVIFFVSNDLTTDQRMQRICSTIHTMPNFEVLLVGRKRLSSKPLPMFTFKTERLSFIFEKGFCFYMEMMIRYFCFGLFRKANILVSIDADTLLSVSLLAFFKRCKHVHDAHELFTQVPELIGRKNTQKVWQKIEQFCLPKVDLFYTVSNALKAYYQAYYAKEIHLIKNVPTSKPLDNSILKQYDVIYQGAINKGRGLLELIDAAKIAQFSLCIVGTGDLDQEIADAVNNQSNIKLLGAIPPATLHALTQSAKIGFNMLDNTSKSYAGALPNKTFDYMMAGIPQLISNSSELVLLNNAYHFAVETQLNANAIAQSIQVLLHDGELLKQLSINAIKASELLNWEQESKKLIELYQKI